VVDWRVPAALALLSSLLWGVADFVGGLASRRSTPIRTLAITMPAGLVAIVPVAFVVGGEGGDVAIGVAAGVCGALGILALYAALTAGPMGVVSPVAAVISAAIPVVVGLARGERPGIAAYVGMALAVAAIVLVGLEPSAPTDDERHQRVTPQALGFAAAAGVAIGGFYVALALAPQDAGMWPVAYARATSTVLLVGLAVVLARRARGPVLPVDAPVRWLAAAAGVIDVVANALYLAATRIGLLSVVSVLGALYPATTVLLARFVLAERLRASQKAGMGLALAATALLAIG
jgi:drug/metabolite transporter (DMT)-like permease